MLKCQRVCLNLQQLTQIFDLVVTLTLTFRPLEYNNQGALVKQSA